MQRGPAATGRHRWRAEGDQPFGIRPSPFQPDRLHVGSTEAPTFSRRTLGLQDNRGIRNTQGDRWHVQRLRGDEKDVRNS